MRRWVYGTFRWPGEINGCRSWLIVGAIGGARGFSISVGTRGFFIGRVS